MPTADSTFPSTDVPATILFTEPQRERLLEAKAWWQEGDLSLEYLAERARQEGTLRQIRALLDALRSEDTEDSDTALLAPLLTLVRSLSPNRALNRALITPVFAESLRDLLFGSVALPVRLTRFLRQRVGVQTTAQLLYTASPDRYPLVSPPTRAIIAPTRSQIAAARKQVAAEYPDEMLPRVVRMLLTDFALYAAARAFLEAESFVEVNAILWHAREIALPPLAPRPASPNILREASAGYSVPATNGKVDAAAPHDREGAISVSDPLLTEPMLLEQIEGFIAGQGFTFPPLAICNYYIALKTKPFVILSGISGTGKTRLTELFAQALTDPAATDAQYLLLPVRPDWNDSTALLGFYNIVTDRYISTPFLEFLTRASRPEMRERAFFVCLDEMNLARVEYYFADLLSAMEGRSHVIPLHDDRTITIPPNLFLTGSINTDEATFSLSKKVLDRANTIEFSQVELAPPPAVTPGFLPENAAGRQALFLSSRITDNKSAENRLRSVDVRFVGQILAVLTVLNTILEQRSGHFGYRIRDEVLRYVANSFDGEGIGLFAEDSKANLNTALDLQILQKVLPRLSGTYEQLAQLIAHLVEWSGKNPFPRTQEKLVRMRDRAAEEGIVTYYPL